MSPPLHPTSSSQIIVAAIYGLPLSLQRAKVSLVILWVAFNLLFNFVSRIDRPKVISGTSHPVTPIPSRPKTHPKTVQNSCSCLIQAISVKTRRSHWLIGWLTYRRVSDFNKSFWYWFKCFTTEVIAKNFQIDVSAFDHIPSRELYIFPCNWYNFLYPQSPRSLI